MNMALTNEVCIAIAMSIPNEPCGWKQAHAIPLHIDMAIS